MAALPGRPDATVAPRSRRTSARATSRPRWYRPSATRARARHHARAGGRLRPSLVRRECSGSSIRASESTWQADEGDRVDAGALLCRLAGPARGVLTGERTALNFLQTLSGTATDGAPLRRAVAGHALPACSTRARRLPGLRTRRNTRCGAAARPITASASTTAPDQGKPHRGRRLDRCAVAAARRQAVAVTVEVEVETLDELARRSTAGADMASARRVLAWTTCEPRWR